MHHKLGTSSDGSQFNGINPEDQDSKREREREKAEENACDDNLQFMRF